MSPPEPAVVTTMFVFVGTNLTALTPVSSFPKHCGILTQALEKVMVQATVKDPIVKVPVTSELLAATEGPVPQLEIVGEVEA